MNVTEVHIRKWVWLCRIGQWASDDGKWSTSTIEDVSSYKQNIRKSKILFVRAIWRRSVDQPSAYNTEPEPEPEPDQHLAQTASRAAIIMIIIICAIDVVCCVRYGIHLWPLYLYIEWFWIGSICGPVVHSPSSLCTRTRHFYFLAHWHGDRSFLSSLCLCLCLCLHVSLFTLCFACPCNGKRTEPAMPKWRSRAKLLCTRAMRSPPHTKCPEPSQWCARKTRQARARQNSRQRPMMVFDTHANCT